MLNWNGYLDVIFSDPTISTRYRTNAAIELKGLQLILVSGTLMTKRKKSWPIVISLAVGLAFIGLVIAAQVLAHRIDPYCC